MRHSNHENKDKISLPLTSEFLDFDERHPVCRVFVVPDLNLVHRTVFQIDRKVLGEQGLRNPDSDQVESYGSWTSHQHHARVTYTGLMGNRDSVSDKGNWYSPVSSWSVLMVRVTYYLGPSRGSRLKSSRFADDCPRCLFRVCPQVPGFLPLLDHPVETHVWEGDSRTSQV